MNKSRAIVLPNKIGECHNIIKRQAECIAWLEKQLFGSKRDKLKGVSPQEGPTLFDEEFNEVYDARQQELGKAEQ